MTQIEQAEQRGYEDASRGIRRVDNPYEGGARRPDGTYGTRRDAVLCAAWLRGWERRHRR